MVILVPYDGSTPAQKAVEHALEHHPDEEIVLLRVVEVASGMIDAGISLIEERIKEREDEVAGDFSAEVQSLLESEDVAFSVETATGDPAREIVAFAEDEANDVEEIVIGSHGREGVSHVLLGSVAETVVRRAPTSVTVVR